jgi:hypothetical protein
MAWTRRSSVAVCPSRRRAAPGETFRRLSRELAPSAGPGRGGEWSGSGGPNRRRPGAGGHALLTVPSDVRRRETTMALQAVAFPILPGPSESSARGTMPSRGGGPSRSRTSTASICANRRRARCCSSSGRGELGPQVVTDSATTPRRSGAGSPPRSERVGSRLDTGRGSRISSPCASGVHRERCVTPW